MDRCRWFTTINRFFVKKDIKLKKLEFLSHLNGKTCHDLERSLQRTIDDTQFITYQIEAQTPRKVRYSIFDRINTGGLSLNAQEIRQALNQEGNGEKKASGVKFLAGVISDDTFKRVVGISNKRMAAQELALRFIAFKTLTDDQFTIMQEFLDLAMEEVDKKSSAELKELKQKIIASLLFSEKILGHNHKFSRSMVDASKNKLVNKSLFDVLMICFDEIADKATFETKKDRFTIKLNTLLKDESSDFFESITKGTSDKKAKETRF
ncbi:MAG: hypothetical protein Q9M28_04325 [Mariprofundaceae bacterium]|nr:hypothetical protein [Mariprofundaceae bacterium]